MMDIENQIKDDLEIQARLKLFSIIEPGSISCSVELKRYGAVEMVERIIHGPYEKLGRESEGYQQLLRDTSIQKLWEEIEIAEARFITPNSKHWPTSLNDLSNPPIDLIIKGANLPAQSISIVGTRKPT
ncbi:MAG: DNA-processing protein DprA, partial [Actinomycetota bacterium]